jgi:LysM repeat protein
MVLKFRFLILSLLFLFASEAFSLDSLRVEKVRGRQVVLHQVDQGETLYSLSKRYNSDLKEISKFNQIENNAIALGQILKIPLPKIKGKSDAKSAFTSDTQAVGLNTTKPDSLVSEGLNPSPITHTVQAKETLFAISRMYDLSVDEIKELNDLSDNTLALGQVLVVGSSDADSSVNIQTPHVDTPDQPEVVDDKMTEYLVQSGDMLETIARKFGVRPDSIVHWNKLSNTYLAIGQRLQIKGEIDSLAQMVEVKVEETGYSQRRKIIDSSGFTKVLEEGIAKKIEDVIETDKYLAMHRTLRVGTMVEIRNLMNNKKIFVRIVGKLPETGLNEDTLIRLTPVCFKKLGVIDPKTRVEISYYED